METVYDALKRRTQELRYDAVCLESLVLHLCGRLDELKRLASEVDDNGNCRDSNILLILERLRSM